MKKPKPKKDEKVSSGKNTRDMKRLCKYLENKRVSQNKPFTCFSLRDSHLRSISSTKRAV